MMTSISEKTRGLPLRSNSSSVADCVDPSELTLVDVEIVRFLNACEKGGVELLNSWPYIQEWMIREKGRKG